jgi:hypothetical protein
MDFSWGFQLNFSSGTRSNILQVLAASASNKGRNDSANGMAKHSGKQA